MSLEAGKLRHLVRFERLVAEVDSDGQQVQDEDSTLVSNWELVAALRAAVEPVSAREFVQSAATQAMVVARITIRHTTLIDASCRAVFRGKVYNIEGILPDKDSGLEYLTLPCSMGVSPGL
jgi:SPP1 family predicted phage head-tail adaptor